MSVRYVDVRALFRSKNPAVAARIPPWIYEIIGRIIHEDEINRGLAALEGYRDFNFADHVLSRLGITVRLSGAARIPSAGRITFCANHPTGGADGLALIHLAGLSRGEALIPVNDLLFSVPQLESLFVPIDKHGSNLSRAGTVDAMYASDKPVIIFPAGRTARPAGGTLRDFPWSRSFIRKSREHGRTVVPVHVSGANSRFFYALWRMRTLAGVRANLEMFLLVDEMIRKRGTTVVLTVGEPWSPDVFGPRRTDAQWAELLRKQVERIGGGDTARRSL